MLEVADIVGAEVCVTEEVVEAELAEGVEAAEGVEVVVEGVDDGAAANDTADEGEDGAADGAAAALFFLKKKMITLFSSNPASLTNWLSSFKTFPEKTNC